MPKKIICLIIILILVTIATGCGLFKKEQPHEEVPQSEDNNEQALAHLRKTVFYFVNEHNLLVPVTRDIPWVEGIGRATLEGLVDSYELRSELADKGLKPSLPEGTLVLGMTIRDGLAKVDFNANFLQSPDKAAEQNAINSVVYTLTEFPSIDQVQILVDGKTAEKTPNGNQLKGVFSREDINLETQVDASMEMVPITLYFKGGSTDGSFNYYVPVTRMVKKTQNQIKTALEELVKGPTEGKGLVSLLPKDTMVLDVIQKDSEVVVNLSKEIEGYGGGIDVEQSVVNSVVLTVSEFPGVETVCIQVEGQADVLPEGTVLETPIFKPLYVNSGSI
jgi:germination protein M